MDLKYPTKFPYKAVVVKDPRTPPEKWGAIVTCENESNRDGIDNSPNWMIDGRFDDPSKGNVFNYYHWRLRPLIDNKPYSLKPVTVLVLDREEVFP